MNPKQKYCALLAVCLAALPAPSQAGRIYTCDVNGVTVYTSRPSGSCHSADLPAIGRYSSSRYDAPEMTAPQPRPERASRAAKSRSRPQAAHAAPMQAAPIRPAPDTAYAPKPALSNSRRAILETELNNERRALSEAQKTLAQARGAKGGMIDRQQINQLEGSVLDRQQNIQALQRELGRM